MPYESTQSDLLTTIMSLFSCHTMFNIRISFFYYVTVDTSPKYKKEAMNSN